MNITKIGLASVAAAGVVALAIAQSSTSQKAAPKSPSAGSAPAKAAPAAPAATPAPFTMVATDPNAPPAVAAPAGPAGKAEIKELVFDAGTVERGADITHAFTIKNVGEHDLTVDAKPG